jgi:hypothetical protein
LGWKNRRCSSQDCKCLPCIRSAGQLSVLTRIARYFLVQHTKNGKKYEWTIKYTKWKYKIPKCNKIDQMVINLPTSSIARPSKIYPNWDFWFENIPYGIRILTQTSMRNLLKRVLVKKSLRTFRGKKYILRQNALEYFQVSLQYRLKSESQMFEILRSSAQLVTVPMRWTCV